MLFIRAKIPTPWSCFER